MIVVKMSFIVITPPPHDRARTLVIFWLSPWRYTVHPMILEWKHLLELESSERSWKLLPISYLAHFISELRCFIRQSSRLLKSFLGEFNIKQLLIHCKVRQQGRLRRILRVPYSTKGWNSPTFHPIHDFPRQFLIWNHTYCFGVELLVQPVSQLDHVRLPVSASVWKSQFIIQIKTRDVIRTMEDCLRSSYEDRIDEMISKSFPDVWWSP